MKEVTTMKKIKMVLWVVILVVTLMACGKKEDGFAFVEEHVTIQSGEYELAGILTIPKSNQAVPAILLVSGSGPNDMDSTTGKLKPFKDLAESLAKQGIATLRYHKVSYQHYLVVQKDVLFTLQDEYMDSVKGALDYLVADRRIDSNNLYVLGHSQGGQMAPYLVNHDTRIKGSIIMAGTSMHLMDLIMEQYLVYYGEQEYSDNLLYALTVKNIKENDPNKSEYFYFGAYYAYWLFYNQIDFVSELLEAANKPMLIMHGGKDLQINRSHFDTYQTLLKDTEGVSFSFYETLNHFFVDGVLETIENAYQTEGKIPDDVIEEIVTFVLG